MLIVELSNHPAAVISAIEAAVEVMREEHAATLRWWQVGVWLRQRREVRELMTRAPCVDLRASHRLAQQRAGVAAEDR
ncbi:MAG: hypothetical protein J2P17_18760 [Mycobacterium sp.]|nr:hypothetical protein [Mycobacterium sp.]